MKVEVTLQTGKLTSETYIVNCGEGAQNVLWIATTVCQYPKMVEDSVYQYNFVPVLLKRAGKDEPIHPRKRICEADIEDGDQLEVLIKDRNREWTYDEKMWYDQAFGKLRNMMRITIEYTTTDEKLLQSKSMRVFCRPKYSIAQELKEEFDINK